jgi:hypothetical protein
MDYISDSFYHFTPKKEYLYSIIQNGFYPRYCIENYDYLLKEYNMPTIAIPMVCFCDIPIVFIEDHTKNYGEFAIAMKKEWGEKKLNPLLYLTDNSIPQKKFELIQWDLMREAKKQRMYNAELSNEAISMFYHFQDFIAYLKKYRGKSSKHNGKEVIFYREREWRWIPEPKLEDIKDEIILRLDPSEYSNIKEKNKLLEKEYKLDFSTDDVDYLIVNNKEAKNELAQLLYKINKNKLLDRIYILNELIEKSKNSIKRL